MASISHLLNKTKILTVKDHCHMISEQFLLVTQKQEYPNKIYRIHRDQELWRKHWRNASQQKRTDIRYSSGLNSDDYKKGLKYIHTIYVSETIDQQSYKQKAARSWQTGKITIKADKTQLSQRRSGYSTYINSYMSRIDSNIQNIYPNCQGTPYDTNHIFNCPSKSPT